MDLRGPPHVRSDVQDLPPGVVRSWDRIGKLRLRLLVPRLPRWQTGDLLRPARDLFDEVQERRRLIVTLRTFASA